MRKYTGVEKAEVLSQKDHKKIYSALRRVGKQSFQQLSDEEKKSLENSFEFNREV